MKGTKVVFNNEKLHYSSELMRALAHPLRLKILEFIDSQGAINVNKIYNTRNRLFDIKCIVDFVYIYSTLAINEL